MRLVGLDNVNQTPISKYSLGMRQRLGLARAIVHHLSDGYIKQEFSVEEKVSECGEQFEEYVVDLMRGKEI